MSILKPDMAILDETDSGLDIDALRIVSEGVNKLRSEQNSFLVITHYQRLLNYIKPDFVHIIADGRIVKSGGLLLSFRIRRKKVMRTFQKQLNEHCRKIRYDAV